jgi:ubiquinone/menaquinone biosynthesis C-methylase UbiE
MFDNVEDIDLYDERVKAAGAIKADWPDALAVYLAEKDGKFDLVTVKLPGLQNWPEYEKVINDQRVLRDIIENYTGDKVADEHIDVLARPRMN